jgi:hypothetical protein
MADARDTSHDDELKDGDKVLGSKPGSKLPPEAEAEIEKARILNLVVAAIAGCSWGKNMSTAMRRAYADYCRRYDVDPVTEMDNLGGTPYVNADWFLRKLGELRMSGIVKDFWLEHIHADPRLDALRKDQSISADLRKIAEQRWFDMLIKRIAHNAPEDAEAICVCTIVLPSGGAPIQGCKWAGNGTSVMQPKHNGNSAPNPIAEANATLSVESTSIRRAARQLFSHVSGVRVSLPYPEAMEDEIAELQARTRVANAKVDAASAEAARPMEKAPLQITGYNEAEAFQQAFAARARRETGEIETVTVERQAPDASMIHRFATMSDPYGEPNAVTLPDAERPAIEYPLNPAPVDPANPTPFDPIIDDEEQLRRDRELDLEIAAGDRRAELAR